MTNDIRANEESGQKRYCVNGKQLEIMSEYQFMITFGNRS